MAANVDDAEGMKTMRKSMRVLAMGAALAALAVWPVAAADFTVQILSPNGITVACFTEEDGQSQTISGTVTVVSGTDDFDLTLMGNKADGNGFNPITQAGNPLTIANSGPGSYDFEFDVTGVSPDYKSFRVDSTSAWANPAKSRSFDRDECDTPVDEAPFAILLLVTGGLAAFWFANRQIKAPARPTAA
jgi:hypothetical protein